MIDLHDWPTPNGREVALVLEETGAPHRIVPPSRGCGEPRRPERRRIGANDHVAATARQRARRHGTEHPA